MTDAKTPLVSVIIPVYNCEEYLQLCLDSIYAQSYDNYEIIMINDGSTDGSMNIIKANAKKHANISVIDQENHGQGYARNHAVSRAKGEYVLFVDSDDLIEPLTLELAVDRAETDKSDVVHFDWKYSSLLPDRPDSYLYLNQEPFAHKGVLVGNQCDELLQLKHFFSVNNLYRKSFLEDKKIRYGEGRVYEDNIFMMLVATRATKVSLLHSPLYIVRRNMNSSTRAKSEYRGDMHYKSITTAMRECIETLEPRTKYTTYYLVKYFQTKFIFYYTKRIPRSLRVRFLKDYIDMMSGVKINIPKNNAPERILRLCLRYDVFAKKKYGLFRSIILYKTKLLPTRDYALTTARRLKHRLVSPPTLYEAEFKKPIMKRSILFLGFDYRYTGNSKYLFEEMIKDKRFKDRDIRFITNDEMVGDKYRISPHSNEYSRWTARAEVIIAESWIPGSIKKREESMIVQLWHGTPLKKVLFDSSEASLMETNEKYKIGRHWNIMRWDYLLADGVAAAKKLQSSFLVPRNRILTAGYPRVKYLIDNMDDIFLKRKIKKSIGIGKNLQGKKIVLYAPTWRDYNYGKPLEKQDFSYIADLNKLAENLGDKYLVLYHDHHFLSQMPGALHKNCLDVGGYETQELLLIADYLVTDYSSILFDAFPIGTPVVLYVNDFERYEKVRGVHRDIWDALLPFVAEDSESLAEKINDYKITKAYSTFNKKYCYQSDVSLVDFIEKLDIDNLERTW